MLVDHLRFYCVEKKIFYAESDIEDYLKDNYLPP